MGLNLFPSRAAIGTITLPDGTSHDVMMTREFARALTDLMARVGGTDGTDMTSLELMAGYQPALPPGESSESGPLQAQVHDLLRRVEGLEAQTQPTNTGADWEHPGKIGEFTTNSGKFKLVWSETEFRRTATPATAGYMVNQLDAANKGNGVYWSGAKVQVNIADAAVMTCEAGGVSVTGMLSATKLESTPIGAIDPRDGTFQLLHAYAEFGCNGAVPRARSPLGAAATDPATTQTLANNIRTALIDCGIGS